jgi:DNA polymerase-3 subunit epsilon
MFEILQPTAEVVAQPHAPAPAGSVAEAKLILNWLETPGLRLLDTTSEWKNPWPSQLKFREDIIEMAQAREASASVVSVKEFARHTAPR